eukprot:1310286-Amphidinium_carterae.1
MTLAAESCYQQELQELHYKSCRRDLWPSQSSSASLPGHGQKVFGCVLVVYCMAMFHRSVVCCVVGKVLIEKSIDQTVHLNDFLQETSSQNPDSERCDSGCKRSLSYVNMHNI